ncbi:MAG TPA: ABC transporter permease [Pirellulaceae bacterium]|nr:ABC transporter permease [Pirellulaceae bacterium]
MSDMPSRDPAGSPGPAGSAQSLLSRLPAFSLWHEAALALLLAAVLLVAWRVDPSFVRLDTQLHLSTHLWELALIALPMTFIIIAGGIDLSVGSMMALAAVVMGLSHEAGWPLPVSITLAVSTALLAGLVNGWVVTRKIHPLIVTLATMAAYRGIAEGISRARPISGFPAGLSRIADSGWAGVPWPGWLFIASATLLAIVLAATPLGRTVRAIGFNETACRFAGLAVDRVKLLLYGVSGLAAGVAAVIFVARRNTAKADIATGMELDVVTAVVLGGTSIFGGRGQIVGTVLGLALIHELREFVSWRWHNDELIYVVVGALLIASVLLNRALTSIGSRKSQAREGGA